MKAPWRTDLHRFIQGHYIHKPSEWYRTILGPEGDLDITIVSDCFENMPYEERREEIEQLIHQFSPSAPIYLFSADTVQEAYDRQLDRNSEPAASDLGSIQDWLNLAYYTANAMEPNKLHAPRGSKTFAFYSIKGGVGRTTALTHVATLLAQRGHRVLAIDLDVASPGLRAALGVASVPYGIVDYLYERVAIADEEEPTILVEHLVREAPLNNTPGQLFVISTGDLDSLDYLTGADCLEARHGNLWGLFSQEVTDYLHPDIILVDAHAGIEKWAAFALLHAADQILLFLYPDAQNLQGTRLVVKALGGLLPTHFVFSKVPTTNEKRMAIVKEQWALLQAEKAESLFLDPNDQEQINESPLLIPYLPEMPLAETYPVEELLPYYEELADLIDESQ